MCVNIRPDFQLAVIPDTTMNTSSLFENNARHLLDFIQASPSPWHAVQTAEQHLLKRGYQPLDEREAWNLTGGAGYYVVRGGSSLVAFRLGRASPVKGGFRIVGAHTDSPGLRLKPRGLQESSGLQRIGVEVYGSPILATYADRDLGVAGRVCMAVGEWMETRLIHCAEPLFRLPNLPIHLNRSVNDEGLKFNRQTELPLLFAGAAEWAGNRTAFTEVLASKLGCEPHDLLSWDLVVHDTQPGQFWGAEQAFIAASRLDNLSSCHAALSALLNLDEGGEATETCVAALFDHEEVGSETQVGAMSSFLGDVLERIALAVQLNTVDYKRALARSFLVSADAAHAYHPNFPGVYDADHALRINGGPAIKLNAGKRYASDSQTEARFMRVCDRAGVPHQKYIHRSDLACGSTIGPMTAAKLGIATVDVGSPIWSMHSIRESGGALDPAYLTRALYSFYRHGA